MPTDSRWSEEYSDAEVASRSGATLRRLLAIPLDHKTKAKLSASRKSTKKSPEPSDGETNS